MHMSEFPCDFRECLPPVPRIGPSKKFQNDSSEFVHVISQQNFEFDFRLFFVHHKRSAAMNCMCEYYSH